MMLMILLPAGALAQTQLRGHLVSSGGDEFAGPAGRARMSLGQPIAGTMGSGLRRCELGYWHRIAGNPATTAEELPTPTATRLLPSAPNPFNPTTTIRFTLSTAEAVSLDLFDLRGRRLGLILDESMDAGEHSLIFRPDGLASGVYLLRMRAGDYSASHRLVLVK